MQLTNENFTKIEILKNMTCIEGNFSKISIFVKIWIFQNLNFGKIFICELNVEYSTRPENSSVAKFFKKHAWEHALNSKSRKRLSIRSASPMNVMFSGG